MNAKQWKTRTACGVLTLVCTAALLAGCGLASGNGSLSDGAKYQAQGKYRAASIEAKKVLKQDNTNGAAWLLLGKASLWQGNPDDALSELGKARANGVPIERWAVPMGRAWRVSHQYKKLLKNLPAQQSFQPKVQVVVAVLRGDALRGSNQPTQAKQAYTTALKLDPHNARALIGMAALAAGAHDADAARKYVQQALAAAPHNPDALVGKANVAAADGDWASAEAAYTEALAAKGPGWLPQNRFATRLKLAAIQVHQQQYDKALVNIKKLEKLAPQPPQPHFLHAVVLYGQGHLTGAITQLQHVLKVAPDNVRAQLLMGAVNYAKGNDGQAQMYLSNVLGMDPNNAPASRLLSLVYYREGRSGQALKTLRPSVPGNPTDAALLALLQTAIARGADMPNPAASAGHAEVIAVNARLPDDTHGGRFAAVRKALANNDAKHAIALLKAMPEGKGAAAAQRTRLLVMAYVHAKQPDKAVEVAAANANAHAKASDAHLLYGTALVADHKYDKASVQFKWAHKLNAASPAPLLNLAALEALQHNYSDAAGRYQAVLKNHPHNAQAMTRLGELALVQHHRADAIKWYRKAIAAAPTSPAAYVHLVTLYGRSGKFDQAAEVAGQLAHAFPDNPQALNALGTAELDAKHPDKALQPLKKAVQLAPQNSLYRVNLARAQLLVGKTDTAKANLEQVVQTDPKQVRAVRLLAYMKMRDHDLAGAVALARTLQHKSATKAAGFALEGDLYMATASYQQAASAYGKGLHVADSRALELKRFKALRAAGVDHPAKGLRDWLSRHPHDASMRMLLAQYYTNQGHNASAAAQYKRVLKAYPSSVGALNDLAWVYVQQHNPKALALAEKAHKLAPSSPGIADTYGWALLAANQPKSALPILAQAAKDAPKVATIRYHLAVAQARTGDQASARATLKALAQSGAKFPERDAAQELYRKLGGETRVAAH